MVRRGAVSEKNGSFPRFKGSFFPFAPCFVNKSLCVGVGTVMLAHEIPLASLVRGANLPVREGFESQRRFRRLHRSDDVVSVPGPLIGLGGAAVREGRSLSGSFLGEGRGPFGFANWF